MPSIKNQISSTVDRLNNDPNFLNVGADIINNKKSDISSNQLEIILYCDMENCAEALIKLVNYCEASNVSYAYINHNKDKFDYDNFFDPNTKRKLGDIGSFKKPHIHFVMFSPSIVFSFRKVANTFSIPYNLISTIKSLESSLLYLTHICYPSKAQYDILDVVSNVKDYVIYLYENVSNLSVIDTVFMYLSKCVDRHNVTITELTKYLKSCGFRDFDIKQYNQLIRDYVKDHNDSFTTANNLDRYVIDRENNLDIYSSVASDDEKYKFNLESEEGNA